MWSNQASVQIEAIHAMLASGHRSVHMERHTLILWGFATAGLILVATAIFTPERFPVTWLRAVATTAFISAVLAGVAYFDFYLIRRRRDLRDESISFVQLQMTKVWWLLVGLIVLINLGMHFFGGGYMFYSLVLILMGLALYIHGLFSKQMLTLAGLMMILLGLASMSLRLPFPVIEWLTICVFGLGWPLLGLSLNMSALNSSLKNRLLFSLGWLCLVCMPVIAIYQAGTLEAKPDALPTPLATYLQRGEQTGMREQVVTLAAGSSVPLNVELSGDVLDGVNATTLPMLLSQQLDIVLTDGKPDGRFRVANGPWKKYTYNYRIRDFSLSSTLDPKQGSQVKLKLHISTDN
jgi:hypothetical protein